MIQYIFQVIVFQALFIVVYDVFLKKETFFNHNRAYLLITSVLALVIPFVKLQVFQNIISNSFLVRIAEVELNDTNLVLETEAQSFFQSVFNWNTILIVGALLAFVFLVFRLSKLFKLIQRNRLKKDDSYKIVTLKKSTSAYSFFNYIFLGDLISEEEKQSILTHEKVHVQEKHSIDLIWFELLKVVFWFNPLVYLFQYRIKETHEFIADAKSSKDHAKAYKNVLLNQLFQSQHLSFVNPFFKKSIIKNRLIMLSKSKSNQKNLLKYMTVIPLVFAMLVYSSCVNEEEHEEIVEGHEVTTIEAPNADGSFSAKDVDKIALFPGCDGLDKEQAKKCFGTEIGQVINKNFNLKLAEELNLEGSVRIISKFIIDTNGDIIDLKVRAPHPQLEEETKRVLDLVPSLKPAMHNGKAVKINYVLPIKFNIN